MKTKLKTSLKVILPLLAVCISACSTKDAVNYSCLTPPFKNITIKPALMKIDPQKGGQLKTSAGSVIDIPEDAFVYIDGRTVSDMVDISFSEFRSPADVIASGIPMDVDSAGKTYHFQTAGMFRISGTCSGEPVEIASGKNINVNFASGESGSYDIYFLDPVSGKWQLASASKSSVAATASDSISKGIAEITKPVEPVKLDKNKPVLDFDVNIKGCSEINFYSGLVWQYSDNEKYPDPANSSWVFSRKWSKYSISPLNNNSSEYLLCLSDDKTSFTTSVVPVMSAKNYKKNLKVYTQKLAEYNSTLEKARAENARLESENKLYRSFGLNKMGIYNFDICTQPGVVAFNASYTFDDPDVKDEFNSIALYMVTNKNRSVIQVNSERFLFDPKMDNKLLAVLPDDRIAYYSAKDFKKIDINLLQKKGTFEFVLNVVKKKIDTVNDLNSLLNSI